MSMLLSTTRRQYLPTNAGLIGHYATVTIVFHPFPYFISKMNQSNLCINEVTICWKLCKR